MGYLADPPDIFFPIPRGEAEVLVQAKEGDVRAEVA